MKKIVLIVGLVLGLATQVFASGMGIIVVRSDDNTYGYNGYVYMYDTEEGAASCHNEIVRTGARGTTCSQLSVAVPAGTKVYMNGQSGPFSSVVVQDGPKKGQSGLIFSSCFLEIQ